MTTPLMCKCYATALSVVGGLALSSAVLADDAADDAARSQPSGHRMMEMMDANGDGKASSTEHAICAKKMFEKMDADKDGKVTAVEMDATHKDMPGAHHDSKAMQSAEKIKTIDANKDGALTAQEHEAGSRQMFGKMDIDKDGSLSAEEIKAGHDKMMTAGEH